MWLIALIAYVTAAVGLLSAFAAGVAYGRFNKESRAVRYIVWRLVSAAAALIAAFYLVQHF